MTDQGRPDQWAPAPADGAFRPDAAAPGHLPPLAEVIARPKKSGSRATTVLFAIAGAIAIGGLAFAAGRMTAPVAAATNGRQFGNGQFANGGANGYFGGLNRGQGGFGGLNLGIEGTVTAVTADSISIKLANGNTVTIPLASSTTYHTTASGTASDVVVGSTVRVSASRSGTPGASPAPNGAPGGGFSFGAATDVTVTAR